jgi:guanylate kinase
MKPIIFTLTGPTCAGKSTLEKMMVSELGFANLISDTTRQARANDVHGVNYYFNTREGFVDKINSGKLIEAVEFNGEFYGLSVAEVNRVTAMGKPIVVVVEPGGRQQIQAYCKKNDIICKSIFVSVDIAEIAKRFITRIMEDSKQIDASGHKKFIKASSSRLEGMMTHEREWGDEQELVYGSRESPYDYSVHNFDNKHTEETLKHIGYMLKAMQLSYA